MGTSNSRNLTFIVVLLLIASFVFGYLLFSSDADRTIYTNVSSFNSED